MTAFALSAAAPLRSRFAVMPMTMHLIFCAFATVVFIAIFLRKKTVSSLVWLLICDTTAILQFFGDKSTATAVAVSEIFLFAILIFTTVNEKIAAKRKAIRQSEEAEHPDSFLPEDLNDIDKLIKSETSNLADSSDDVIKNAFEDDHR